jgi:hypothetical protein
VVFDHGMVVAGVVEAPMLCLQEKGRLILPSLSEAMWNSSMESSVMAHYGDCVPSRAEPMMVAPEPSFMGKRLCPLNRSTMNMRLLKRMLSPKEKTSLDKCSPSTATVSTNEGTIKTSRGKARCKSPFLACQLLLFFAPTRYRVVKIARSYSEMALQTTKYTIVYPGSDFSLEIISLRLAV